MHQTIISLFLLVAVLHTGRSQEQSRSYLQFIYQNDYFTATDQYFTQGIRLEYGTHRLRRPLLAPILLCFRSGPPVLHSFFLAQDGYTPTSIRTDSILRGDRPYAGALYVGQRTESLRKDQALKLSAELQLGVIGPWALVGEFQTCIHEQTGTVLPMGWPYQIRNDLLLNYQLEVDQQLYHSRWFGLTAGAHAWLGTYRSRLGLQGSIAFGWNVNDLMAGSTGRKAGVFVFVRTRLSLIGYDASLQGGLWNKGSVYTISAGEVQRWLPFAEPGLQVSLGRLQIAFSHSYIGREFQSGRAHVWGTANIRFEL